jgi:hypothetical protein
MAVSSSRPSPTIRDFIADDARVVAVDSFHPLGSQIIERGRFYRLSDAAVRTWPAMFAVCIPVSDVLVGEIER